VGVPLEPDLAEDGRTGGGEAAHRLEYRVDDRPRHGGDGGGGAGAGRDAEAHGRPGADAGEEVRDGADGGDDEPRQRHDRERRGRLQVRVRVEPLEREPERDRHAIETENTQTSSPYWTETKSGTATARYVTTVPTRLRLVRQPSNSPARRLHWRALSGLCSKLRASGFRRSRTPS
jgi:hypothetical protein